MNSWLMLSQSDTTKIELPVETARLVLKDLYSKDYLENQILNLELQLNTQNELIQNKEAETENLNGQIETYKSLVESKDLRISNYEEIVKKQENIIKSNKRGNTFWKITTVAGVLFGGYMAIK